MSDYAEAMRRARKEAGLTMRELSEKSGVTEVTICSYENGTRTPRLPKLVALADALSLSMDAYIGRSPAAKPEPQSHGLAVSWR